MTALTRANDPATSKGKRKVNRYEQAVLDLLYCEPHGPQNAGLTGKEMAIYTGHPLNCITPRFAPLRRKGLIKDSGMRRDKQIVWVLVDHYEKRADGARAEWLADRAAQC